MRTTNSCIDGRDLGALLKGEVMAEILTFAEIMARYDSEWVLLEDPELTPELEIVRGKVIGHSKDRDEVSRTALKLMPKH